MKSFIVLSLLIFSQSVFAQFEGAFFDAAIVPESAQSVHLEVFDMARTDIGCSYAVCFRMDVYVNGIWVARWATSPGNPNNNVDFDGVNTPLMVNRDFNRNRIMGSGYVSGRGDSMPYAMFILGSQGQNTGFAVHAGRVTGQKESHGCIRLEYDNSRMLNRWMRQVLAVGGSLTITTHHTAD